MKAEYDFSKGEQGKFYHPDAEFHLPVYLDPDVSEFMRKLAANKNVDVGQIVNDWLRTNIRSAQAAG
ncbi:MAG TPA: hypothetical protein ENK58_09935 [Desulfobacterales bacterium]|nr:hypothetical protein [Desulfobacterales bacterium]